MNVSLCIKMYKVHMHAQPLAVKVSGCKKICMYLFCIGDFILRSLLSFTSHFAEKGFVFFLYVLKDQKELMTISFCFISRTVVLY